MNALIRLTREDDAPALPDIERSSGEAFRAVLELAWIADDDVQSVASHLEFVRSGLSWVAVDERDRPLGFLCAEISDGALHIWQLAVLHERQGLGLGRALIAAATAHARDRSLGEVTLTTFRELAWNERFYRKLGFLTLGEDELGLAAGPDPGEGGRQTACRPSGAARCACRSTTRSRARATIASFADRRSVSVGG
ncbi:GNAT family N-acetyltransferase [Ensifer canadensis]